VSEHNTNQTFPLNYPQLVELYGKETTLELLNMSVTEAKQLMHQIEEALGSKDKITALAQAHQLKGLAGTMTIDEMGKLSKQMEDELKQDNWESAEQTKLLLKNAFVEVEQYINSINTSV
jgi:HPt (histidine-containing phosphotransfer) domain-containing protein